MVPDAGFVLLPGSERAALSGCVVAGEIDSSERIEVTLITRRRDELPPELITGTSVLSRDELSARYGADPADLDLIVAVLVRYGIEVVSIDVTGRRVIVTGTIAMLEETFGASLQRVSSPPLMAGGGMNLHRYREGVLRLPAELDGIVLAVLGLDDRPQARPHARRADHGAVRASFTPPQVAEIYRFPAGTDGSGQTLAFIELGGGFSASDLDLYFSALGLSPPSVTTVGVDGASNAPGQDPFGADVEVVPNIEIAGAVAPGATQVVYFAPNTDRGFVDAVTTAVHAVPTPTAVGISWGQPEDSWTGQTRSALHQAFADAAALGVTVCVSAGNNGSGDAVGDGRAHVDFPASSPHALACGGTTLHADPTTGAIISETVWNDGTESATGGGISDVFPLPSWQANAGVPDAAGTWRRGRGVPDVAGNADPATGYRVLIDGQAAVAGGTSAVAALWAGLTCRLAQASGRPLGAMQQQLYAGVNVGTSTPGFRSITKGNNGAYAAGPGWDPCTGLGSPDGAALSAHLADPMIFHGGSPAPPSEMFGYGDYTPIDIRNSTVTADGGDRGESDLVADSSDERLAFDEVAAPRVVNVMLADQSGGRLPETTALAPVASYLLRVWLGIRADASVVVNPTPLPLRDLVPASSGGWWFDVVVASTDVDINTSAQRVFLPFDGASWVCACTGIEHSCRPRDRRPYLDIPFGTRSGTGSASLRCTVYDRNNAIQSIRLVFAVGADPTSATRIHGVVDYSLADDLALAEALPPRRLNVLTNESEAATHTILVKGEGVQPVTVDLTETAASEVLRSVRRELILITLGRDEKTTQYDDDNAAPVEQLTKDLETMAYLGSAFWEKAVPIGTDQDVLRPLLTTTATIQIARVTSTVFPWAIVYDYPHLLSDPWFPCDLLKHWPESRSVLATYPEGCPFASQHRPLNTLCPFGFWGFRHLIEQPPSVLRGRLRTTLAVPVGARAATVRSLNLDESITAGHLRHLRNCLAPRFALADCDSRDDFVSAIDTPLPLIYFYCHGRTASLGDRGVDLSVPYLEVGHDEMIGTGDLNAWAAAGQWHRERWRDVPPLVFINGCKTAALSPEQIVTFVDAFAGAEAAGVIGTEIAVAQPLASEFAQGFYGHLMADSAMTVGQALRRARFDFLAKGNITGLVYTAFCSMDLILEPKP